MVQKLNFRFRETHCLYLVYSWFYQKFILTLLPNHNWFKTTPGRLVGLRLKNCQMTKKETRWNRLSDERTRMKTDVQTDEWKHPKNSPGQTGRQRCEDRMTVVVHRVVTVYTCCDTWCQTVALCHRLKEDHGVPETDTVDEDEDRGEGSMDQEEPSCLTKHQRQNERC